MLADLYARKPRLLILTLLLILAAGAAALIELPRLEDPKLTPRFAMVYTRFPGATAERVEALVTEKLEDKLQGFEELKVMESTSRLGMSVLQLELGDEVQSSEVPRIWSKIRDELDEATAQLPVGALDPEFVDDESEAYTLILGLAWQGEQAANAALMRRLGDELQDVLLSVNGTEHVRLFGAPEEEVVVEMSDEQLSALHLDIAQVSSQIARRDAKQPAGSISSAQSELPVEIEGEPDSLAAIRDIPIVAGEDGRLLRLGEIAEVRKGIRSPQLDKVFMDGTLGLAAAARMGANLRIDRWAADVDRALESFKANLPRELRMVELFAQSRYVEARFSDLQSNLAISMGLVLLVSIIMLGWRSAIFVSLALPLTSLMVLGGMRALGIPLHQMSVSGLIIALGMLIDNAIIMVDEVRGRIAAGRTDRIAVVRDSVRMLAIPLFGSTLTTVLAFAPLLLMAGPAGEFVGSIAITVSLALISSLFLSLTIIAAIAARWSSPKPGGLNFAPLTRAYQATLSRLFARPLIAMALAMILPISGFVLAGGLTEQFFPPADRDQFQIQVTLPQQASLEQTEAAVHQADALLRQRDDVKHVHWFVGNSAPQFYYNMMTGQQGSPRFAQALVQFTTTEGLRDRIRAIQADLDQLLPQATTLALQLEQGPPFAAPIELRLFGPDLSELERLGERARLILAALPGVTHTRASLEGGLPKLWFRPREADLRLAGLSSSELASSLQASLDGQLGGTLMEETEELPVRVRRAADERRGVEALRGMEVRNASGQSLPLRALGDFELVPERASITHRSGERMNAVRGYLQAGLLPAETLAQFEYELEQQAFDLPPGYHMAWGGEAAERDDAVGSLLANVGILGVLMLATLVLSFSSFRAAAMVGAVAVLAAGLGMASLSIAGYPFGFMAILGLLGLIGVAINDSIVVLTSLREDEAASRGDRRAVVDVVLHSTRHILTPTVTTIAGFMPLILGGSLFWAPLAVVIAGGVLGATLIALVFVPALHQLLAARAMPASRRRPNHANLEGIESAVANHHG